ncbi:unnamed protein product [Dicrocoelium dendriticum]|nr:unnamed protein product [Dicrocoelium dendriticum]
METETGKLEFEQFDALQSSGLLDSLYDSITLKQKVTAQYKKLNPVIKGRIRALKHILHETLKLEAEFYKEIAKLERRFLERHEKLFTKRRAIVIGEYEPKGEETVWLTSEDEDGTCDSPMVYHKSGNEGDAPQRLKPDCISKSPSPKGIPEFWLTVLRNAPLLSDTIHAGDVDVLKSLRDIRSVTMESGERPGFQLEFEFAPNDYFTNSVLGKRYYLSFDLKQDNPLSFDGPEVIASEGCIINWKAGKNLTLNVSSKTQRSRMSGEKQTITKSTKTDSFFQFFDPPKSSGAPKGTDPALEQRLLEDFDLGQYIRERVIPRAVAYYTGEALDLENEADDVDDFPEEFDDESEEGADDIDNP